jgi:membrane-bound lytic murein transglycosylase D
MAVTAYNHGVAGMLRAKEEMGTYDAVFENYEGKRFGFASRNFYSEFLAARHVAKNHTQYFNNIRGNKSLETREVVTKGQTSLAALSRHYEVDLETLRALNPALGRPVLKGKRQVPKGYKLRLPADSAKGIQVSSAALPQMHPDLRQ